MVIKNLIVTGLTRLQTLQSQSIIFDGTLNGLTPQEIGSLSGVTSNIQTQIDTLSNDIIAKYKEVEAAAIDYKGTIAGVINELADTVLTSDELLGDFVAGIYTIPEVSVNRATKDATLTSGDQMLAGVIGYTKNGVKVTGTITGKAAATYTPGTTNQTIAAGQYLTGAQTIVGDADLVAANIVTGKNIFNVAGTFSKESTNPIAAENVLKDKIGFVNGTKVTGTMPNNGSVSQALAAGGSYTIPKGYHDGTGKVTANSLASQTDGTAVAGDILSGKTAYVDGAKVTGTMHNYAGVVVLPRWATANVVSVITDSGIVDGVGYYGTLSFHPTNPGYYDTNSIINQAVFGLHPDIIKAGELIGGNGSEEGVGAIRGTYTSDATATASQILSGKTAYVNGAKVTGTIASKAAATYTPGTSNQTIAAGQYLSGAQTIAGDADLVAANIVTGKNIFNVAGSFSKESTNPITAATVLSGKIGFVNGAKVTGTMTNQGSKSATLDAGGSYTIPAGYHDGTGKVTAKTLAAQTDGTATAANILDGYTAYVDGLKVTGTMANQGSKSTTLGAGGSYTIPKGYHDGTGKISVQSLATMTASGDATAAQILSGKKAYVDGSLITGTMTNRGAVAGSISTSGGSYTIPAGYHNGSGKVTGPTLAALVGTNVTLDAASRMLSGYTAYGKNGTKYTGSIPSKGAATITPGTSNKTIAAGYYLSGTQTIKGDANLKAANIKAGVSIFGVSGTLQSTDNKKILQRRDFQYSRSKSAPAYDTFFNGKYRVAIGSGNGTNTTNYYLDVVTLDNSTGEYVNRANIASLSASEGESYKYCMGSIIGSDLCAHQYYKGTLNCALFGGSVNYLKITDTVGMIHYYKSANETYACSAEYIRLFRVNSNGSITLSDATAITGSCSANGLTYSGTESMNPSLNSRFLISMTRNDSAWDNTTDLNITKDKYLVQLIQMNVFSSTNMGIGLDVIYTDDNSTNYTYITLADEYSDYQQHRVYSCGVIGGSNNYYAVPAKYQGNTWNAAGTSDKYSLMVFLTRGNERATVGSTTKQEYDTININGILNDFCPICPDPDNPDVWYGKVGSSYKRAVLLTGISYGGFVITNDAAVSLTFE